MHRFSRYMFQSAKPLGKNGRLVTASRAHMEISKKAATDGIVLLKNDGTLPLKKGERVCLFGRGTGEFLFGGGGSGNVLSDVKISLADALKSADEKGEISLFYPLIEEGKKEYALEMERGNLLPEKERRSWMVGRDLAPFPISDKVYGEAVKFGGIALFSILRYSSECSDRKGEAGGFALLPEEISLLSRLEKDFSSVVVILTVCGPVETEVFCRDEKVGALLYPLFGGSMAGEAIVDILLGKKYPSGHLQHTLAKRIEDYPSTKTFLESPDFTAYEEDIFVGYRYFETFCPEKVVYPFGFGLGFTEFDLSCEKASFAKGVFSARVRVTNKGKAPGREVVQLYLSAPQGLLGKPAKELSAFVKTKEIAPGETVLVNLRFALSDHASFDDLGKIEESAFVLEKGSYRIFLGNNVRDSKEIFSFEISENKIVKKSKAYLAPAKLERRLLASGEYEALPQKEKVQMPPRAFSGKRVENPERMTLIRALEEDRLDEFCLSLTDEEVLELLYGHPNPLSSSTGFIGAHRRVRVTSGVADVTGIPPIPTADGPAGFRATPSADIKSTFFPCGTAIAQTWDLALIKKVGATQALEVKENNAGIYLAPGMNIHRSPLCGRNFEYYSEDPVTTGLVGAAAVSGIQSQRVAATIKHFCCNNKELNRREADSRVSERALREIYLKGFEIAIKKASPWCIMTSYNIVNGTPAAACEDLLRGILRGEWGYEGLVMTDWWVLSDIASELSAGSDVKMPHWCTKRSFADPDPKNPEEYLRDGEITIDAARDAVKHILTMMSHLE